MKNVLRLLSVAVVLTAAPTLLPAPATAAVHHAQKLLLPGYTAGLAAGRDFRANHTSAEVADEQVYAQQQYDAADAAGDRETKAYWDGYLDGLNG